jgi:hypothetical protein
MPFLALSGDYWAVSSSLVLMCSGETWGALRWSQHDFRTGLTIVRHVLVAWLLPIALCLLLIQPQPKRGPQPPPCQG